MSVRGARARAAVGLVCVALAGCLAQLLPEPPAPARTYDFGPLPAEAPEPLVRQVRLAAVDVPSWLSGFDIHYRRLDEQPGALRTYAQSQWIAPVPELVARRLDHRLARAAPRDGSAELTLRLEILAFEQVFTSADEAHVMVQARARIAGGGAGTAIERELMLERASEPHVSGATRDLPAVADDLIDEILRWLRGPFD